jgi:ketosteroid isomerase-like protein
MKRTSALFITAVVAGSGIFMVAHVASFRAAGSTTGIVAVAPADDMQQQVAAAERRGLDALKAGDVAEFRRLTADEAIFVDDRGPATKADVLKNVAGFTLTDYSIEDVRFVPVSWRTGLISYKTTEKGNSHGHDFSAQVYVSSVWTKRGNDWVCLFSQETAVRKPVAAAAPASH